MASSRTRFLSCLLLSVLVLLTSLPASEGCANPFKIIKDKIKAKFKSVTGDKAPASYLKGCFIDNSDMRDLPTFAGYDEKMDVGLCAQRCQKWKKKYLGLQEGSSCWCGNSFGAHGESADSCQTRCLGNDDEMCGGKLFNSVYELQE
ncbi:hypothetical protein BOX15_Mlig007959g1 [Macrostomum lignano]|uniref:WSC domain-containing protein n=1 Tax=Macrostomum lignano TaxID=282301 RepID=A0A267GE48_9PLAT|nr:hypothetical protein BOX15_Mlig007959g1 [Macrostomum lignano]